MKREIWVMDNRSLPLQLLRFSDQHRRHLVIQHSRVTPSRLRGRYSTRHSYEFLKEFDVFAPAETGRTRDHKPAELMRGFLHCYYYNTYVIYLGERDLRNTDVWLNCGFDRPPSRDAVDRFLTDLEHLVDDVFDRLVEQTACRGLLDLTYSIDSTDMKALPADLDAAKCYDPSAKEYYHGYGCTIIPIRSKIPIAVEFTERNIKQAPEETVMRVTRDALAVAKPIWTVGDSDYTRSTGTTSSGP